MLLRAQKKPRIPSHRMQFSSNFGLNLALVPMPRAYGHQHTLCPLANGAKFPFAPALILLLETPQANEKLIEDLSQLILCLTVILEWFLSRLAVKLQLVTYSRLTFREGKVDSHRSPERRNNISRIDGPRMLQLEKSLA